LVSWSILWEHLVALALVWGWVTAAGFALLPILRLRVGWTGAPLVGVVYWTLALYLFRFRGGLDVAAGVVALLIAVRNFVHPTSFILPASIWRPRASTIILVLGSLPYLITLLAHYVPPGMDASMHTTAAALIARHGGLPDTFAPFAPDVTFPTMNLGLPTVAAMASRTGCEPASAMLACHHFTFTLLMLAAYLLVRSWVARTPAAILAVVSVWMARASQATLEWGGYPTVLSVALGVFAAVLIWRHARAAHWRLSVTTGATIAAIPLIHGVGAGIWLYCVGPWMALAAFLQSGQRRAVLRGLAISALSASVCLGIYRSAGNLDVQDRALAATHEWQQDTAILGANVWLGSISYVYHNSGSLIVAAGWAACGVLLWRRQWPAAALLASAWGMMVIVIANSRFWALPASFLLYPERALYFAAPLSAVALALAWRAVPIAATRRVGLIAIGVGVLALAGYYHNLYYQKIARLDRVTADGWEALLWAKRNLEPTRDYVRTPYNSTGSFLPSVAQVGCSGAHNHHFIEQQVQAMYRSRRATHVLIDQSKTPPAELPAGTVVFQNRSITIVDIRNHSVSHGS
jgi:hypothetical protein